MSPHGSHGDAIFLVSLDLTFWQDTICNDNSCKLPSGTSDKVILLFTVILPSPLVVEGINAMFGERGELCMLRNSVTISSH